MHLCTTMYDSHEDIQTSDKLLATQNILNCDSVYCCLLHKQAPINPVKHNQAAKMILLVKLQFQIRKTKKPSDRLLTNPTDLWQIPNHWFPAS